MTGLSFKQMAIYSVIKGLIDSISPPFAAYTSRPEASLSTISRSPKYKETPID